MLVIGRITKDAVVKTIKDDRQVVEFSLAVNDWYKPKGAEQSVKVTTYFNCAYWLNAKIVQRLTKGVLVEAVGRVSVNVYKDMNGEAKGSLNFHVNTINIHSTQKTDPVATTTVAAADITAPVDDLPF